MNAPLAPKRMTVDEFIPWAMAQPSGRYELLNGEVVMMSPERIGHVRAKTAAYLALATALNRSRLGCEAIGDGMTVRINARTAYEPDALVHCGPRLADEAVEVPEPVIVVEVLSPGTKDIDTGVKFVGYFSLPSVRHYLIVDPAARTVLHHARDASGTIVTTSHRDGTLILDPPGIEVAIAEVLPKD